VEDWGRALGWGGALEGTYMQDVSAAGQVAAMRQGRPPQVHATFGAATCWRLAIRRETEATDWFAHCFPLTSGFQIGGRLPHSFPFLSIALPTSPPHWA
jgi:hypothetical protein